MPTNLRMNDYLTAANQLVGELGELRWSIGPIHNDRERPGWELVMQQLAEALRRIFERDYASWSDEERHDLILLAYTQADDQAERCWGEDREIDYIFALEYSAISEALAIFGKLDLGLGRNDPRNPRDFESYDFSVVDGRLVREWRDPAGGPLN